MNINLDISPETEASLSALAASQGLSVSAYLRRLLEGHISGQTTARLSPSQRAAVWRLSARKFPRTPLLSDEEISRETLYAERRCERG